MEESATQVRSNTFLIYLLGFLFTFQAALPTYVTSSFLSRFTGEKWVGLLYAIAAAISIAVFAVAPGIVRRFGNYKTALALLVLEFLSLLAMAFAPFFVFIALAFFSSFVATALIGFSFDIFLEHYSKDNVTGKIRGLFMTSANAAWVILPIVGSFVLTDGDYWKLFFGSAILVIPVFYLIAGNLKHFRDPAYPREPGGAIFAKVFRNKNIWNICVASFLLNFFYSWMVIYLPILLHDHIGFSWGEIGVIFSVMLLPFVLTESLLGRLADTRFGEKEILSIGFVVLALTSVFVAFVGARSMFLWMTVLFVSRIGASMVEIMSETYFFKKVRDVDIYIISFFRTIRPWSYIVSPLASGVLFAMGLDLRYLFVALGFFMFFGLRYSLAIEDTL